MWEEFLQGPDSASTGSSDCEGNGSFQAGMNRPQSTTSSSDDEGLQQGLTSVNINLSYNIYLFVFFIAHYVAATLSCLAAYSILLQQTVHLFF